MSIQKQELEESVGFQLNTIEEAIEDIRAGKIIIVVDDEDRENEGDFICAAEMITPEIINFMATHGRGLICTPITEERAVELSLDRMVSQNTDLHGTAFTISIDYKLKGCTTGISAYDRATGIKALTLAETKAEDFARPGHIFPLIARPGGVLRRTGHTEAAIDMARLAGYYPAGVLVEILNQDGSMARLPQLVEIARKFNLKIITIKDLVAYQMSKTRLVKRELSVDFDTAYGLFEVVAFTEINANITHLAIKKGEWEKDELVLTRVHSSTNSSEILGSLRKGYELPRTLKMIAEEGKGLLVFLRYKDEPDHFLRILKAVKEQQERGELVNPFLRKPSDAVQRDLGIGAQIIHDMGIRKMRLITNNPKKRIGLIGYGLEIIENVSVK